MTPTPTRDRVLEERTRGAWATYALTLEGLEGREYEEAEAQAWATLQRELELLAAEPSRFGAPPGRTGRV